MTQRHDEHDTSVGDRRTSGAAAREALGEDPEELDQMRRETSAQPGGGLAEPSARSTGFADTGQEGAISQPTTSVAGTHAPDVPGTPHRRD
jgi:hypothetical protein